MTEWDLGHTWGYTHGFAWPFMIVFWIFVVLGIVAAVRWLASSPGHSLQPPKEKSALVILEERLARGEIDHEEYEQKRQVLKRQD
jgi:putative membrane protein